MKYNSFIVGSIPNVRHVSVLLMMLIRKDWKYTDTGILDKTHLRFFTEESLKRVFVSSEYIVEKIYGINQVKLNSDNLKTFFKSFLIIFMTYLFGRDSRFLQFGFRIKPKFLKKIIE